jgi:hypothetical protein
MGGSQPLARPTELVHDGPIRDRVTTLQELHQVVNDYQDVYLRTAVSWKQYDTTYKKIHELISEMQLLDISIDFYDGPAWHMPENFDLIVYESDTTGIFVIEFF